MDRFKDFFTSVEDVNEEQINKALSAGYGTDSATITGGRSIIPEDIEMTMVNVMAVQQQDCKLMNMLNKIIGGSNVHEYTRRTGVGEHFNLVVEEGGGSEDANQELERVVRTIKYIQTRRAITDQMEQIRGFEEAYASEKIAGTLQVLKSAEYMCFHGNEDVIPLEFDGVLRQIEKSKNPNIYDVRGETIGSVGEDIITEPVRMIHEQGGDGNKLFMPSILVQDIQNLVRDRIRFLAGGVSAMAPVISEYPTAYGTTVDFGSSAGGDRLFYVKGEILPSTKPSAPEAPSNVTSSTATDTKSKFSTSDAGNYKYSVHAINKRGVSVAKNLTTVVAVSAGQKVTLTITPSTKGDETGYIICRSAKDGDVLMEMIRIPRNMGSPTTEFVDLNQDLPGTASLVVLTEHKLQPILNWLQFMPLRVRPLYESNKAERPFFVQLFGALDIKAPEWCALVKNIQYRGGLKY